MDFKIYNNEKIFIYDVENYIEMMSTKKRKTKIIFLQSIYWSRCFSKN